MDANSKATFQRILERALSTEDTGGDRLRDIAKMAADRLGVCPTCGNAWATHNGDGSCVSDDEPVFLQCTECGLKVNTTEHDHCPYCLVP